MSRNETVFREFKKLAEDIKSKPDAQIWNDEISKHYPSLRRYATLASKVGGETKVSFSEKLDRLLERQIGAAALDAATGGHSERYGRFVDKGIDSYGPIDSQRDKKTYLLRMIYEPCLKAGAFDIVRVSTIQREDLKAQEKLEPRRQGSTFRFTGWSNVEATPFTETPVLTICGTRRADKTSYEHIEARFVHQEAELAACFVAEACR